MFYLLAKLYPKPPIENLSAYVDKRNICPMTPFKWMFNLEFKALVINS